MTSDDWRAVVIAHAREARPRECCGVLLGHGAQIAEAMPAGNAATEPTRFVLDPADHIRIRREARARGLDVIGFYHSHPHSAPEPSERDRQEAAYDDHLYLIVSLVTEPPALRLFRLCDGGFAPVTLPG